MLSTGANAPLETTIREYGPKPQSPTIVEGLPGLGSVGRLAVSFLIDESKARKIAELYSPYFPYQAIVNSRGIARLPRAEFYYSTNNRRELMMMSGDCQPLTSYGQYEVASKIVQYALKHSAAQIISIGGFVSPRRDRDLVVGAATSSSLVSKLTSAGASVEKGGVPIVGVAGLLIALARTKKLNAACLLGQTFGLGPDPAAAQRVLRVLAKVLELKLDFSNLDRQVAKIRTVEKKIGQIEKRLASMLRKDRMIYIG